MCVALFRGMGLDIDGGPVVYFGPTDNGLNAANSLGIRPGESAMSTDTVPKKAAMLENLFLKPD